MLRPFALSLFLALAPAAVSAQSVQDQVVTQLQQQGFIQFEVTRTLLGRIRIVAVSATHRREIVLVPETGVILRDYWVELGSAGPSPSGPMLIDPNDDDDDDAGDDRGGDDSGPSGGGGDDEDDDDEDDKDDDEEEDDEEDEEDD